MERTFDAVAQTDFRSQFVRCAEVAEAGVGQEWHPGMPQPRHFGEPHPVFALDITVCQPFGVGQGAAFTHQD